MACPTANAHAEAADYRDGNVARRAMRSQPRP